MRRKLSCEMPFLVSLSAEDSSVKSCLMFWPESYCFFFFFFLIYCFLLPQISKIIVNSVTPESRCCHLALHSLDDGGNWEFLLLGCIGNGSQASGYLGSVCPSDCGFIIIN